MTLLDQKAATLVHKELTLQILEVHHVAMLHLVFTPLVLPPERLVFIPLVLLPERFPVNQAPLDQLKVHLHVHCVHQAHFQIAKVASHVNLVHLIPTQMKLEARNVKSVLQEVPLMDLGRVL